MQLSKSMRHLAPPDAAMAMEYDEMTASDMKVLRARARKHELTIKQDYGGGYRLNGKRPPADPNCGYVFPLLPERSPDFPVASGHGGLEEIEAHLDWLDGDQAKVDAYFDRRRAEEAERSRCVYCRAMTVGEERVYVGDWSYAHVRCREQRQGQRMS